MADLQPTRFAVVCHGLCRQNSLRNVFIAKRDPDALIKTGVEFTLSHVVKRMRIDINTDKQRVDVAYLGLFGKRHGQYTEGRGCTLDATNEVHTRAAATSLPATASAALWPAGGGYDYPTTNA